MNLNLKKPVRVSDPSSLPKKEAPKWDDVGYFPKDMAVYAEQRGRLIRVSGFTEAGKWAGLVVYKDGSQWWWPLHMLEN